MILCGYKTHIIVNFDELTIGRFIVFKVIQSPIKSDLIRLNIYINLISRPGYLTESSELIRFSHAVQPMIQWFDHWPIDPVPLPSQWPSRVLKLWFIICPFEFFFFYQDWYRQKLNTFLTKRKIYNIMTITQCIISH